MRIVLLFENRYELFLFLLRARKDDLMNHIPKRNELSANEFRLEVWSDLRDYTFY